MLWAYLGNLTAEREEVKDKSTAEAKKADCDPL